MTTQKFTSGYKMVLNLVANGETVKKAIFQNNKGEVQLCWYLKSKSDKRVNWLPIICSPLFDLYTAPFWVKKHMTKKHWSAISQGV